MTDISLHIDEAQTLADVVAYYDHIRIQRPPALRAGCVVKLQAVLLLREFDLKDEWLVNVAEERNRIDVLTGTEPPV